MTLFFQLSVLRDRVIWTYLKCFDMVVEVWTVTVEVPANDDAVESAWQLYFSVWFSECFWGKLYFYWRNVKCLHPIKQHNLLPLETWLPLWVFIPAGLGQLALIIVLIDFHWVLFQSFSLQNEHKQWVRFKSNLAIDSIPSTIPAEMKLWLMPSQITK